VPTAHVVIIPNADHYVYISNAEQVVTEINAFLARFH
jgi:non-heme chloroperoxidase